MEEAAALFLTRRKEIVCVCVGMFMKVLERVGFAAFTCILALGGSIMGTIVGGMKGQRSEAGMLDGAGKGAVAGAIAALELLDFAAPDDDDGHRHNHEPLSKVALLSNLFNGKVLMEWVYPAYQWHIGIPETVYREVSDIYDMRGVPGLSQKLIQSLPLNQFNSTKVLALYNESFCSICFQEFEDEDVVRKLPKCDHIFHFHCVDKWLIQQGSCPMCRTFVLEDHFDI
ncbi:NEP1-interacting protein-like 2 isoform X1 [Prosopis cineraria]|uniref:NEP1-interacting protein-like 2 isoform X1 n=1 Tax=Prosopis cineraria TaxID=364024 RepID=UPI00240ECC2E|nr:NEP1-interacting protein-like 2 isoform X1 [Prosopis cineraria]